eukprot:GHVO01016187.1.p1 GENE.GHVO01016187.1~~GHVO01016187.1.p1  ORF type:complete len:363 (-),score=48.33 GHVO01016187.1:20-1108(-)
MGGKADEMIANLQKLIKNNGPHNLCPSLPSAEVPAPSTAPLKMSEPPNYELGKSVATRQAYGAGLAKLGVANKQVVALDGDTKNSTFAQKFKDVCPDRFIECFIAEQNLAGVAIGCATRGRTVAFASTFACFLSRACDQIRMGAISQTDANFSGSHCGVSIGEDGPSQMALEDLAMFRSVAGSTVFYPSDAVSTERAVELAANTKGICFIRTSRPGTTVLYKNDEPFAIGKAKIVRQSDRDQVTVIGCAITMREALTAADQLAESGINIRVIDPFTIKPIDAETIIASAKATGGRVVTVEDHYHQGGLGEAVAAAVSEERDIIVKRLAVNRVARSGKCDELLEMFGISASAICKAVKEVMTK